MRKNMAAAAFCLLFVACVVVVLTSPHFAAAVPSGIGFADDHSGGLFSGDGALLMRSSALLGGSKRPKFYVNGRFGRADGGAQAAVGDLRDTSRWPGKCAKYL